MSGQGEPTREQEQIASSYARGFINGRQQAEAQLQRVREAGDELAKASQRLSVVVRDRWVGWHYHEQVAEAIDDHVAALATYRSTTEGEGTDG